MKKIRTVLLTAALFALAACSDSETKELTGTIADASMHEVSVTTADGRTVAFSTVDADMSHANGLLLGSPVEVTYRGKIRNDVTAALSVRTDPTYEQLVGEWIETTPGYRQGIDIEVEGIARSIGMSTLVYEGWKLLPDGGLNLRGRTIDNGESVPFSDDWHILRLDADTLEIRNDDLTLTFRRTYPSPVEE